MTTNRLNQAQRALKGELLQARRLADLEFYGYVRRLTRGRKQTAATKAKIAASLRATFRQGRLEINSDDRRSS